MRTEKKERQLLGFKWVIVVMGEIFLAGLYYFVLGVLFFVIFLYPLKFLKDLKGWEIILAVVVVVFEIFVIGLIAK